MPCLVADSGPLIAFAKLGLLDLPKRLFGRVMMPATVFVECQAQAWLADAEAIRAAVDADSCSRRIGWEGSVHLRLCWNDFTTKAISSLPR